MISCAGFYKQEMCPPPKTSFLHPYTFHPDLSQSPRSTMSSSPLSFSSASFLHSPQPHTSSLPSPFQSCHHRSKGVVAAAYLQLYPSLDFYIPHRTSPRPCPYGDFPDSAWHPNPILAFRLHWLPHPIPSQKDLTFLHSHKGEHFLKRNFAQKAKEKQ